MNFYGRMPMGFSGAVSLISRAHSSCADIYGSTGSYSGLFSTPGFIVSSVGKRERGGRKGRREKGNRKGKEGREKE